MTETRPRGRRGAKRGNGEGSIYLEAATHRYRGAVTLPDGTRRRVSGATRQEASDKLAALLGDVAAELPIPDGSLTFADILDDWLTHGLTARRRRGRHLSPNTLDNYAWAVARLKGALGTRRLRDLRTVDLEGAFRRMATTDGLSANSLARIRTVAAMALDYGEDRDLVRRNVARRATVPGAARPPAPGRSLTEDQARTLIATARRDRLEALWLAGLLLGLRPGELTGLTWPDVDLDGGILHVRNSLKRERGQARLGATKTPRSVRSLDMPTPLIDALRRHQQAQTADRLAAGSEWWPDWPHMPLVFTAIWGTPLDSSNLRRRFAVLTTRAGLGRWTPKELRHSAVSLLSAAGVPLESIADLAGHSTTRMTGDVYRHAVRPTVHVAVAPMEALAAGAARHPPTR